jgi:hypothetical protein
MRLSKNMLAVAVLGLFMGCEKDHTPVDPPVAVPTELEGTEWTGRSADLTTFWAYDFVKNTIVIKRDVASITDVTDTLYAGTFVLDTAVRPKKIDISITKSSEASAVGRKILTYYKYEAIDGFPDNTMLIMYNAPGAARPAEWDDSKKISLGY